MYYLRTLITSEAKEEVFKAIQNPDGEYEINDGLGPSKIVDKEWLLRNKEKVGNLVVLPDGEIDCVQGWVSPAQKKFFKDSKVVDVDGHLKVCYIGLKKVEYFEDLSDLELKGTGKYHFTDSFEGEKGKGRYVLPVFLAIREPINPLLDKELVDSISKFCFEKPFIMEHLNSFAFKINAIRKGYDGAVWVEDGVTHYLPFSPYQIQLIIKRSFPFPV